MFTTNKKQFFIFLILEDDSDDLNDLYSNAHKIVVHHQHDSDEELVLSEYFDEYFHYLF